MNIIVESSTPELVLNVGEITLGTKNREKMENLDRIKKQKINISTALCALLNSGGGVIKARIENQDYSFSEDGLGRDLESSFNVIKPPVQKQPDFDQKGDYIFITVKP